MVCIGGPDAEWDRLGGLRSFGRIGHSNLRLLPVANENINRDTE
jgi:hypothetical protein